MLSGDVAGGSMCFVTLMGMVFESIASASAAGVIIGLLFALSQDYEDAVNHLISGGLVCVAALDLSVYYRQVYFQDNDTLF